MRFTNITVMGLAGMTLAAALGCAEPVPPTNPSWDTDVYPILRGSCLHCHGSNTTASPPSSPVAFRFDLCNAQLVSSLNLTLNETGLGAAPLSASIAMDIDNSKGRPKMPPPPAAPLNDYERKVLQNWTAAALKNMGDACKKSAPNRKPEIKLVRSRKDGDTLWATVLVSDPDDDQVVGKLTAGNDASVNLDFLGQREVKLERVSGGKLSAKISDGWDTVETSFDY
jgi:hypothetical protein